MGRSSLGRAGTNREMIVRAFKKCGISVAADGSEDYEINLKELEDYETPILENTDTDEDPFPDLSDDDNDVNFTEDLSSED